MPDPACRTESFLQRFLPYPSHDAKSATSGASGAAAYGYEGTKGPLACDCLQLKVSIDRLVGCPFMLIQGFFVHLGDAPVPGAWLAWLHEGNL